MTKILIKVVPASSEDTIVGWLGEALKIKVKAPPELGKANKAVILLLADQLGVEKESIKVVSGLSSALKILEISGLSLAEIKDKIISV